MGGGGGGGKSAPRLPAKKPPVAASASTPTPPPPLFLEPTCFFFSILIFDGGRISCRPPAIASSVYLALTQSLHDRRIDFSKRSGLRNPLPSENSRIEGGRCEYYEGVVRLDIRRPGLKVKSIPTDSILKSPPPPLHYRVSLTASPRICPAKVAAVRFESRSNYSSYRRGMFIQRGTFYRTIF